MPAVSEHRKISPGEKWRQAAGDIGVARKHLKRDSPGGSPPRDADDLFRLLKEAATKFPAPTSTEPARKSRRPGQLAT